MEPTFATRGSEIERSLIGSLESHGIVEKSKGAGRKRNPLQNAILIFPVNHAIGANQQSATSTIHRQT